MSDRVASRWGDAAVTQSLSEVSWMASTAVLMHLNERATGDPARDWLSSWAHRYFVGDKLRVLVLGCGEGWLERAIAKWQFVSSIDAIDVAQAAIARAAAGAPSNIHYSVVDLNRDALQADAYDVVVAHMILHHVENLEHALGQIECSMRDGATLIVNEYVGPKRFQYSELQLNVINELLACLPANLRQGRVENRVYERKERPTVAQMMDSDPSEAVRSDELLPMLQRWFDILERKEIAGGLLQHLLYDIVQNFRFADPRERSVLDMLCTFDAALLDASEIPCDFMILSARKRGSSAQRQDRPLPPRPAEADEVEPDPLRKWRRVGGNDGRRAGLKPWHLRMLRYALASTQSRRANLFAENLGWLERLRHRVAGVAPFAWIRGRYSAYGDDPTILGLLETFERRAPKLPRVDSRPHDA